MNIVIFSTRDLHHTYYINNINNIFPITNVIYENRKLLTTKDNSSPFENDQNKYEKNYFFSNTKNKLCSQINTIEVNTINSKQVIDFSKVNKTDVVIVFGCGKIDFKIIEAFDHKIINIHRKKKKNYRGLDSDLWAVKNSDFNNIGTTIHYIDEKLDTGDIVYEEAAKFNKTDKIYMLRAITTDIAIRGTLSYLNRLKNNSISRLKQHSFGNYYSSMTRKDKEESVLIFNEYINKLIKNES